MTDTVTPPPLLQMEGIEKSYGGVRALRDGRLIIQQPGTVHGLIGENGSGKSTILGILSGQIRPDGGALLVEGRPVSFSSPVDALRTGIAMVSQETALAPLLSVTENILLGRRLVRGRTGIDWRRSHQRAKLVLDRLGLTYDPRAPIGSLRPDQRQMVEIARALSLDSRVLILDEPTSSLSEDEVASIFQVIRNLSSAGVSTILVTHRLSELFEICDEITVLRDGRTVASGAAASFNPESLVSAMVGDTAAQKRVKRERIAIPAAARDSAPVLTALNVSSEPDLHNVELSLRPGEIVGLAGLVGAGRSDLLEAIFGARPRTGDVLIENVTLAPGRPSAAIRRGIGYVPPDRKTQGVVLGMSVVDNAMMVASSDRFRLRPPGTRRDVQAVSAIGSSISIRTHDLGVAVSTLSGGNQQKVALSKWLIDPPRVLLLDEPTRGVDVAAKAEIHQILVDLADRGVALLVSSSENDELLNICDRIVVMLRGRVVATVARVDADEAKLSRLSGGHLDD
ncbi:sugar ABC transporter ATP-binding protein [Subtercola lobariae]|uniref:Ribose ABC transporter n=1 Tax=Subtercola lobariae TaxID=1588641 RepID=A0A917F169_9MICO|nr:sugar ABC transporter ATP-binding protein [Subtercola lobariae]GGF38064.1 ribose ABC transporter [Subtercola lobariae]